MPDSMIARPNVRLLVAWKGRTSHTSSKKTLVIAVVGDKVCSHAISSPVYPAILTPKEFLHNFTGRRYSRRLSPNSDSIRVPTECLNMLLQPAHSSTLISKGEICISLSLSHCQTSFKSIRVVYLTYPHFLRVQESKSRQTIIDRDTQHRLAIQRTLLDNVAHIIPAHPQNLYQCANSPFKHIPEVNLPRIRSSALRPPTTKNPQHNRQGPSGILGPDHIQIQTVLIQPNQSHIH